MTVVSTSNGQCVRNSSNIGWVGCCPVGDELKYMQGKI